MGAGEKKKILIVDDVETNRILLKKIVEEMDYQPVLTENGQQALMILERIPVNLIILDVAMPVMDGYECCQRVRENPKYRDLPIVFISAFDEPKDIVRGFELGGTDYVTKPFIPEVVKARVGNLMNLEENKEVLVEMNRKLNASVLEQRAQIEKERKAVLQALNRVARENAAYDSKLMERLSYNCRILAEAMELSPIYGGVVSEHFVDTIEQASVLCDLGNVAVPTEILQKKGPLTKEERAMVQRHTEIGAKILTDIVADGGYNDVMKMAIDVARCHHENWDGNGYPGKCAGDDIPLAAQMVAVISDFCAITERRSYREAIEKEQALEILQKNSGVRYNPQIVDIMTKISRQLR